MFHPTLERLENREVFATLVDAAPALDPLRETISLAPVAVVNEQVNEQAPRVATGDVTTDGADFVQGFILPYIEQDNLYKQFNSARGDRALVTQLSQDLLGRSNDTQHDAALNQLGLAGDSQFDEMNRPQGIIAILIG
jgi:hypothetical protein